MGLCMPARIRIKTSWNSSITWRRGWTFLWGVPWPGLRCGFSTAAWRAITEASESYLDSLTPQLLATHWEVNGAPAPESIGTSCHRITFHYWYHLGEMQAIRQLLGQADLPTYVGNLAPTAYRPTGDY